LDLQAGYENWWYDFLTINKEIIMSNGTFAESFEKAFTPALQSGAAVVAEELKSKRKARTERLQRELETEGILDVGEKIIQATGNQKRIGDF